MFLVNETMVEWVNNEIYRKGFDTTLYYVRSYDEYEWGWIVDINSELPTLDIAYLSETISGILYVHRNGYILDEYNSYGTVFEDADGDLIYDSIENFVHIAESDENYNWREFKDKGIPYKDVETEDE